MKLPKKTLNDFLQTLYDLFGIPICIMDGNRETVRFCAANQGRNPYLNTPYRKLLLDSLNDQNFPSLYFEYGTVYTGLFRMPDGKVFLLGPAAVKSIEAFTLTQYCHEHHLGDTASLPLADFRIAVKILAMAFRLITGQDCAYDDISMNGLLQDRLDDLLLSDYEHFSLLQLEDSPSITQTQYEERLLEYIQNGKAEKVVQLLNEYQVKFGTIGVSAVSRNRQVEYMMISLFTLVSRAAIQGGMNPEKARALSEIYMQRLSKCTSTNEMYLLAYDSQVRYAREVAEAKEQNSHRVCVEKCKDYILKNLRRSFKIHDIADAIRVNRSYLSRRFTESEGMTIQQYITLERCRHAANMLRFSDYPILMISEYFCFSSQSHFSTQFKKTYHLSPSEYRRQNRRFFS